MKIEEMRAQSAENLRKEINDAQIDLMKMRMSNKIGNLDNPVDIRKRKRTIARMKTVLTEMTAN